MGCVAGAGIKVTPMHWESYVSVQDSGIKNTLKSKSNWEIKLKNFGITKMKWRIGI